MAQKNQKDRGGLTLCMTQPHHRLKLVNGKQQYWMQSFRLCNMVQSMCCRMEAANQQSMYKSLGHILHYRCRVYFLDKPS